MRSSGPPGYGTVIIDLESPNGTREWRLQNVMWCPDLGHNLLGTLPLARNNIEVRLKPVDEPSEFVLNDECFGYADIVNLQYIARGRCIEADTVKACVMVTPQLLHRRMGHLGWNSVMNLPKHATGVMLQGTKPEEICGPCMKGHQRRKFGHTPMPKATKPFQLIHSDLGGPYPMTREGYRYYITFTDDFTGCIWLYLLKKKSDAFLASKHFKAAMETQSKAADEDFVIVQLRSDRGGEYIEGEFQ